MEVMLTGRSAVISGASKGLGLAMATEFARSGANVAILARRADVLAEAKASIEATARGGKVLAVTADVSQAADCQRAFAAAEAAFGAVDILVNNAGTSRAMPFETITDALWQEDLELKLFGAIRLCRLAFPAMKQRRWGRIINVLNIGAKAPRAGGAPTAVSRAAGMALTKVLANEGAPHNVLVNALLVGQIVSDQWVRRHAAQGANEPFEAFAAKLGANIPLGRLGRPEEFAAMACLLCSEAGGFTTGTAINMDGGASPVV
jgi:3-oxoacyl-[acyl-carrier protein] reductase